MSIIKCCNCGRVVATIPPKYEHIARDFDLVLDHTVYLFCSKSCRGEAELFLQLLSPTLTKVNGAWVVV